jgi:hypothetical protein
MRAATVPEPIVPPTIVDPEPEPQPEPIIPEPDPTHTPVVPPPAPEPGPDSHSIRRKIDQTKATSIQSELMVPGT